ncbi:MAG: DUF4386 family protein [Gemmatirosa sp.]|nr:DUF4386 family protein [Gemmatirosa sp.]
MRSAKSVGRIVGILSLGRMLLAPVVYAVLLPPVLGTSFLADAAGSALRIRVALLLTFVFGALTLGIAIVGLPVLRRHGEGLALTLLSLSVVGCATLAIDDRAILDMLSLSQADAAAGAPHEVIRALGGLARTTWRWAHFSNLVLSHGTLVLLSLIAYRGALVPRALAAFALAAALLSTGAVAMPLLGYRFESLLLVPTALGQLALTAWLLVRGFVERAFQGSSEPQRVGGLTLGAHT